MIQSAERSDPGGRILQGGRNCWRIARARRAKLLIDGSAYFSTLRQVAREARRTIFVIGWDVDSRTPLIPGDGNDDGLPLGLGAFLDALVRRRKELNVYVLDWDFAMLYALDREFLPIYSLGWRTHRRLHFHMDNRHPPGASHHQKFVVVDDAVAFVGGIDLTKGRWDTPAHEPENLLRRKPDGEPYPPFHDAQLMIDGEAAAAMGELARRRWRRATGKAPEATRAASKTSMWPAGLAPDFEDVDVGIARTEPSYEGRNTVHEIRQLFLDCIMAARRSIYIENQYFTSPVIAEAIARRLREPDGPEIIVTTRCKGSSWLEQNTMYVLRARLIRQLAGCDTHGRLRFYYPDNHGLGEDCIALHTKLMIVDERLLRVGSSNLNNRSLGVDSECDLAVEARGPRDEARIGSLRDRLLAEHLGVKAGDIAAERRHDGSLIRAIERVRGNPRTLVPLPAQAPPEADALVPDVAALDPERPIDPNRLMEEFLPRDARAHAGHRILSVAVLLVALMGLAAGWRWGPLGEWLNLETLRTFAAAVVRAPASPVWVLMGYVLASLIAFPITVLIVATVLVFGPWAAFTYALLGSALGAAVSFGLGRFLGRDVVRRLAGRRINRLSRRLGEGGVFAVVVLRLVPIAPFTVINLVAGASHLRARDFLLGTAIGMMPGILVITVFTDRLVDTVFDPSLESTAVLAAMIVTIALVALGFWRRLQRRTRRKDETNSGVRT